MNKKKILKIVWSINYLENIMACKVQHAKDIFSIQLKNNGSPHL